MPKRKMPTAVKRESGEHRIDQDDVPTPVLTESSKIWHDAAVILSRKLIECAKIKRRCGDVLDFKGSERAYHIAKELVQLSIIIDHLPGVDEETAAMIKRASIDRIVLLYKTTEDLLTL